MDRFKGRLVSYLICIPIGVCSGTLVGIFLHSLSWVTVYRQTHPLIIWGLPLVGLLIPFLYKTFGFGAEKGIKLVLEEVHTPSQVAPWSMAPLIYLTTLLTHLVGGSAGREGTALQIAASFADRIAQFFTIPLQQRRWVLMAGLSAGFSAALGAPWAGMIFGLEVIVVGHIDRKTIIECFIASFISWAVAVGLGAPHFQPMIVTPPDFSFPLFFHLLMLAIFIGITSRVHVEGVRRVENVLSVIPASFRTALGGLILLIAYLNFPLNLFQGLGLESIHSAFQIAPEYKVPLFKFLLTALTLAVGFKGGEFIPLVFIGATSASVLAQLWQEPIAFFTALGFVSLFGAAAKTPWTCAVLAIEYFGWEIAPYALLVTLASYATAGPFGIYSGQRILQRRKFLRRKNAQ